MNDYGHPFFPEPPTSLDLPSYESPRRFFSSSGGAIDMTYLRERWQSQSPLTALVVSDAAGAELARAAGIEILVVGFSEGGPPGTPTEKTASISNTLDALTRVREANEVAFLVADVPYKSYRNPDELVRVARRLAQSGADAVKLEGGVEIAPTVKKLSDRGVAVVGHIGYTPKTGMPLRRRGRTETDFVSLQQDAEALIEAGARALVLEMVQSEAATLLTQRLEVPTIGVFSGGGTSGQALVLNDILDVTEFIPPGFPFGKPRAIGDWTGTSEARVREFYRKVKSREFPYLTSLQSQREKTIDEMWTPSGSCHFK